ncbi:MAG: hypothetical protein OEM59_05185 [Rhodospirillales bacterium]|nr:hypothetical protein [Rhodospirillales bacterium]
MAGEPNTTSTIPDDLRLLYENAIGNIEFSKRQQWWLAAQTLILYTGIFALFLSFDRHTLSEFILFEVSTLLIAILSVYFMIDYDFWRKGERKRMEWIRKHCFSPEFREAWRQKAAYREKLYWTERYFGEYAKYFDPTYLLALIVVLGGVFISYYICKVYQAQIDPPLCWT